MFNAHARKKALENAQQDVFDLLIVGGGINGAGVARDAAMRGLRVLLLEAQDFAFGTSSRSSKLIHGGIRYLENMEFGLVHEALMERRHLLQMAPHMVHPLRFMIPVYKSSRVGLWKMEAGMILYDLLSFFEAPKIHEFLRARSVQFREPTLKAEGLTGAVIYSDAYMEDDRLVIETLRSAHKAGAQIANYASVNRCDKNSDGYTVHATDTLTQKKIAVKAKHVVGCVGPWTDLFASQNMPQWKSVLRPTKGIHLLFPREKIPVRQAVVMAVQERIVFVIPREDMVIVGTTDTDFKDDPSQVSASSEDVDYLLRVTNDYFPNLALQKSDIVSCYSGVRPLVQDGSGTEGKTSREHQIFTPEERLTLVAGGKYTTYRSMAQEIVDVCLRSFSFEERMNLKPADTTQPLNPAATVAKLERLSLQVESLAEDAGVSRKVVEYLIKRRGEEATTVLGLMKLMKADSEKQRLWQAEAQFCIQNEMCLNLVDFYCRRSPLFLFHKDNGRALAPLIAPLFTQHVPQEQIDLLDQKLAFEFHALSGKA
jgi:glycerol-3-phosphate dehydrogenase